jgi:hypothetical protein
MRVGGLFGGAPLSLECRPCGAGSFVRLRTLFVGGRERQACEGRRGEGRAEPAREQDPGGHQAQESYAPVVGLNRRRPVADSRAEQDPEGGSNVMRVVAPETACGCARGAKL